jgi:hypothetical protein
MSTFLIQRQEPIQKIREEIYRRSVVRMGGFSEPAKLSILLCGDQSHFLPNVAG